MESQSPINWFGGKFYMADSIVSLFPPHKIYVEVFGGGAHVLFAKSLSEVEVYNDIDEGLINFFKILRDKEKSQELHRLLQLTPYSRKEFSDCNSTYKEGDEIEKARKWYTALMQSFSKSFGGKGWSYSKDVTRRGMSQCTSQWLTKIDENMPAAVARLRSVQIEYLDYKDLIEKYDGITTLFYLDPPYIHDTRKMTFEYEHEMDDIEHKKMVEILKNIKGKAILSGYDHKIYNELGWEKISIGKYDKRSMAHDKKTEKGEEWVWINYSLKNGENLFEK